MYYSSEATKNGEAIDESHDPVLQMNPGRNIFYHLVTPQQNQYSRVHNICMVMEQCSRDHFPALHMMKHNNTVSLQQNNMISCSPKDPTSLNKRCKEEAHSLSSL